MVLLVLLPMRPVNAQTATFYSDWYIGRRTANGQVFNQGGMTAAHPTLPMGSRVRVTNRNNGRSVIVRINDRCKCSIDLSKAAFQQLAPLKLGRIPVRIERLR